MTTEMTDARHGTIGAETMTGVNTTLNQELEVNKTTVPSTDEIRDAIRDWAHQYAAQAEERASQVFRDDPTFQEWAAETMRRRPDLTLDNCVRRWVGIHDYVNVPWPAVATPDGCTVDVGRCIGGEVTVGLDREILDDVVPTAGASVGVLLSVVVDTDPTLTRADQDVMVGDFYSGDPFLSYWGVESGAADVAQVMALSRVLVRATGLVPQMERVAALFGGIARPEVTA